LSAMTMAEPRIREPSADPAGVRLLGIFRPWRLQAYGYTLAGVYALLWLGFYAWGGFPVDRVGRPRLNDFTAEWLAGKQALHGKVTALYEPRQFENIQEAITGPKHRYESFYRNWPYPPIFFFALAPLAMLPYLPAFLSWEALTLLGCIAVVFLIVRRRPAIALVLASPFTAWNFYEGQSGFLTAALVGASLLSLERQPVLAGMFIGCLTYKPQFGILFPVALIAARQWRAIASAVTTFAALTAASIVLFGMAPWRALPHELLAHADIYLFRDQPYAVEWAVYQTFYGLVRDLHGGTTPAWLIQGCVTIGLAVVVWQVWRSRTRYALKAALLSAAILIATPFGFAYDMAAIVIPIAFLAADQIRCGLLRGEQTALLALFAAGLAAIASLHHLPVVPLMVSSLIGLILRRAKDADRYASPARPRPELAEGTPGGLRIPSS
jgi:arabinofuranan 3-O-arabinosyltransferase